MRTPERDLNLENHPCGVNVSDLAQKLPTVVKIYSVQETPEPWRAEKPPPKPHIRSPQGLGFSKFLGLGLIGFRHVPYLVRTCSAVHTYPLRAAGAGEARQRGDACWLS